MKVNQTLTLDLELVEKLRQESNASALVNMLLMKHYRDCRSEKQILSDTRIKIAEKKHKAKIQKLIDKQLKRENEL